MANVITSANAIVEVNKALYGILKQYLDPNDQGNLDIRFDLPEIDSIQSSPTVSVFLYDVHEDLQLRQSAANRLNVSAGSLRSTWVNLNCNYLLTYWEAQNTSSDGRAPGSSPDNQAMQITTRILHALLTNRELKELNGAHSRVIPPQENLNSLGNFWQSLGNRPRLSLMYSVTVPILLDNSQKQILVKTVQSKLEQKAAVDNKAIDQAFWEMLCTTSAKGDKDALARVECQAQIQPSDKNTHTALTVNLIITGVVSSSYKENINTVVDEWRKSTGVIVSSEGADIYVSEVNSEGLVFVSA